jgi:cytochrome bd-type quinol oxidase subunit 2
MGKFAKIVGINLLIFLLIVGICAWLVPNETTLNFMVFAVLSQVVLCFAVGGYYMTQRRNDIGLPFVLTSLLLTLIGFSVCVASF